MNPSHGRIQLFSHMLFVHQSLVKEVSVLKRGQEAAVCENHYMEEGFSWKMELGSEAAWGGAAWLNIHPPAGCPINLRMQSISQTAD